MLIKPLLQLHGCTVLYDCTAHAAVESRHRARVSGWQARLYCTTMTGLYCTIVLSTQVWVPATGPGSVDGELPDRLSDAAFDDLASAAASRAAAQRQKQQQPYSPPDW
jgi:hypothetical protein